MLNKIHPKVRSFAKKIWHVAVIFIVIFAALLTVARILTPLIGKESQMMEQWATEFIGKPIRFERVQTSWHDLGPSFNFHNVRILSVPGNSTVVKVAHLKISINLLSSLFNMKLEPGNILISGVQLFMERKADGQISILGFKKTDSSSAMNEIHINHLLNWLLSKSRIKLNHISVHWREPDGVVLPFSNIHLLLLNQDDTHRLRGQVVLAQTVPTAFQVAVDLEGEADDIPSLHGVFYLRAKKMLLQQWLHQFKWQGLQARTGEADFRLWGKWKHRRVQYLQALFDVNNADIAALQNEQNLFINRLTGQMYWLHLKEGWQLTGDQIRLRVHGISWPENNFQIKKMTQPQIQYALHLQYINSADLNLLITHNRWLKSAWQTAWKELQPHGALHNLVVNYTPSIPKNNSIKGEVTGFGLSAWKGLPGFDHIDGEFFLSPEQGNFDFNGFQSTWQIPQLFSQPLSFTQLVTRVHWQHLEDGNWLLQFPEIAGENQQLEFYAQGGLLLHQNGESPLLSLVSGFSFQPGQSFLSILPNKVLKPKLVSWLRQAIVSHQQLKASLVVRGHLKNFPFAEKQGRFLVNSELNNVELKFHKGWPAIDDLTTKLNVDGRDMLITANEAKTINLTLHQLTASLKNIGLPSQSDLLITSKLNMSLQNTLGYINASPLKATLGKHLASLTLQGPGLLNLSLQVPLHKGKVQVQGQLSLLGDSVAMPALKLNWKKLRGELAFTEKSISATNVTGEFWQYPVSIGIQTYPIDNSKLYEHLQIRQQGKVAMSALHDYLHLTAWQTYLQGLTDYQAELKLFSLRQGGGGQLIVASNLAGIVVDLPKPLRKPASETKSFIASVHFNGDKPTAVNLIYNKILSAALAYHKQKQRFKFYSGEVKFGAEHAKLQKKAGLLIDGKLATLNEEQLKSFFKKKEGTKSVFKDYLRLISLKIDDFTILQQRLRQVLVNITADKSYWHVGIASPTIVGKIQLPTDNAKLPIIANMEKLYLKKSNKNHVPISSNPTTIPAFDLTSANTKIGNKYLGRVVLHVRPIKNGITIQRMTAATEFWELHASGSWQQKAKQHLSELRGQLTTKNVATTLKNWGYKPSIIAADGRVHFNLHWLGTPMAISVKSLSGDLLVSMPDGGVIEVNQAANEKMNLGRFLNILNLDVLQRRLRKGSNEISHPGYSFHGMQGVFTLAKGNAVTRDAYMKGPVADVRVKGRVGLAAENFDLNLTITPHLTGSLPLIATIAGGPIAGVITWVVGKVVSPIVEKAVSYHYRLTGPWHAPRLQQVDHKNYSKRF